ncbi:MAG: DUF4397 domain-containing protein [Acidobacteriota bacterium]
MTPSVTSTSEGQKTQGQAGTTAAQNGDALVRLVNVDSRGSGVDIVWGDKKFFSGVAYKSTTPYKEAPRGTVQFKLRAAGGTEDLSAGHVELLPGRHYTLVAFPDQKGGTRLEILSDKLGLLDLGEARVRLINATTDVDDLDLFLAGTKNRILHGADSGRTAIMSFADMMAGTVEIRSPSRPAPTLLAKLDVEADRLYTFIVVGSAGALDVVQTVDRTGP